MSIADGILKNKLFLLNDKKEMVPCTLDEWLEFCEKGERFRIVKQEWVGDIFISTEYTLSFYESVFRTRAYNDTGCTAINYSHSWGNALATHCTMVKEALEGAFNKDNI